MKKMITAAAAVLALGTTLAFAAPRGDGWKGHGGHEGAMSEKLAQKLNLSDAQKAQVKVIHEQFRTDNAAFFQNFRQTMQDFHAAKQANDQAKLDALRPTMEAQHAQMKQLRDAERAKIRTILTPEQQAQLDAMKAKHESRHEKQ
ncbi:MAG TPA: Spy/CpxP family protein refolding chaperone [Thermoanaerobaculia bacterium]